MTNLNKMKSNYQQNILINWYKIKPIKFSSKYLKLMFALKVLNNLIVRPPSQTCYHLQTIDVTSCVQTITEIRCITDLIHNECIPLQNQAMNKTVQMV